MLGTLLQLVKHEKPECRIYQNVCGQDDWKGFAQCWEGAPLPAACGVWASLWRASIFWKLQMHSEHCTLPGDACMHVCIEAYWMHENACNSFNDTKLQWIAGTSEQLLVLSHGVTKVPSFPKLWSNRQCTAKSTEEVQVHLQVLS